MTKAVSYIRVSVQNDNSSIHSVQTQTSIIENYAKKNGIEIVDRYQDINQSGGKLDRFGLVKAIEYAKKNNCSIIVKDLSRLSRSAHDCLRMLSEVNVIDCTLGMNADDKVMMMMALMADWERKATSERLKQYYQYIKKADPNRKFGNIDNLNKGRVIANERRSAAADEYALKLEPIIMTDENLSQVANKLMCLGIKTRLGRDKWTARTVKDMRKRIEKIRNV